MGGPWRDIQGSEWRLRRICHPAGVGRGRLLVALSTAHAQAASEKGWLGSQSTLIEMDEKRALSNQLEGLDETAQGGTEAQLTTMFPFPTSYNVSLFSLREMNF